MIVRGCDDTENRFKQRLTDDNSWKFFHSCNYSMIDVHVYFPRIKQVTRPSDTKDGVEEYESLLLFSMIFDIHKRLDLKVGNKVL